MLRCVWGLLVIQLTVGCSTLRAVDATDLRGQVLRPNRRSDRPLALRTGDNDLVRLDPNSEIRFFLPDGTQARWVRGSELWHSEVGISFAEPNGVFLLRWQEIAGAEVRNLSAGKTTAAILVTAVIVGVVVVAVLASLKGSGGGGGSIHLGGMGGGVRGGRRGRSVARPAFASRRLLHRGARGVHLHVPLAVAAQLDGAPCGLLPAQPPYAQVASTADGVPLETPAEPRVGGILASATGEREERGADGLARRAEAVPASPLFAAEMRRRHAIQLFGGIAAGTELVRFDRYAGSAFAGLRLRDAFELGGGVRHMLAPLPSGSGGSLASSVVGFGRVGAHLGFGTSKMGAIALSLDAGSGYRALLQLKFNMGLRIRASERISIGVFPFTPTFNYYKEDSPFKGALRWTFPSSIEVAFRY